MSKHSSLFRTLIFSGLWVSMATVFAAIPSSGLNSGLTLDPSSGSERESEKGWVRIAVVAASSQGMDGDKPLRFAYRDGERLQKMLGTVGQIAPENLFLLKVEGRSEFQASLGRIGERIRKLKDQNHKVFLQFYYSGHGGARTFHFKDGGMDFSQVKEALGGERADARVFVLDVCFGASFFTAKGFRTAPPVQLQLEMDRAAKGEVMISSSSGDEQAYEVRTLGGSIFTSHWIMALRGAGDANRDGQVTLFEAYNYAYDRTAGYSAEALNRPQHPSYQIDLTGARDVMLARLLQGSTGILFQNCPTGLYNLLDVQRGIQIGELRIPEGEDFTLALEPGHYRVQYQASKGKALAANIELSSTAMTTLPFSAFTVQAAQSPGLANAKGSEESMEPMEAAATSNSKLSYSAFWGLAGFKDATLQSRLDQKMAARDFFGFKGGFTVPLFHPSLGMDVNYRILENWTLGIRLGYSAFTTQWKFSGVESLHSVADSLKGQYPVQGQWSYKFTQIQFGAMLGRTFKVTESQSLKVDGAVSLVSWQVKEEYALNRILYRSQTHIENDLTGSGYRLETGITYLKKFYSASGGKNLAFGLRLAPYFTTGSPNADEKNPMNLASKETGLATTLSIHLF